MRSSGATIPWTNASGGSWGDPANWNSGAGPVPGIGDVAQFNLAQTYQTTLAAAHNLNQLAVGAGDVSLSTNGFGPQTLTAASATFSGGVMTLAAPPPMPPGFPPIAAPLALSINNTLNVQTGATLAITAGNDVTNLASGMVVGTVSGPVPGAVSEVKVDGVGSSLSATGTTAIGGGNAVGRLTLTNSATASLRTTSGGGSTSAVAGTQISVSGGADLAIGNGSAGNGYLTLSTFGGHASQVNYLNVTGAGSTVNQDGGFFTVGGGAAPFAINVNDGGSLTTSGGGYRLDVQANATLDFTGGMLNLRGPLQISNGGIVRETAATGVLSWPDGPRGISLRNGGKLDLAGSLELNAATLAFPPSNSVLGTDSKMRVAGTLSVADRQSLSVSFGGALSAGTLNIAGPVYDGVNPTVTIDGAGTTLTAGNVNLGAQFEGAKLLLKNNAAGTISGTTTFVAPGSGGMISVESGADLTTGNIVMGVANSPATAGYLAVTNAGSTLTQSGAATLAVHNGNHVTVSDGAAFSTGTGGITITQGGSISITGIGSTFAVNGNVSVTQTAYLNGFTSWAAGRSATLTVSASMRSDKDLLNLDGNTISVSGASVFGARDVALFGGGGATATGGSWLEFRSMQLGANGSAAGVSAADANTWLNFTGAAHANTFGASSGSPVNVQVTNGAKFTATGDLIVKPTATLTVADTNAVRLSKLNVDGGRVNVDNGTVSVAAPLAVMAGGRIVLAGDAPKLIVRGGELGTSDGATYGGVSGLIQSGHASGAWTGAGISTDASDAASGLTAIGVATADQAGYAGGSFGGVTVASEDVLVIYTYAGDANLDGFISGDDYAAIDFNISVPGAGGWYNGDFNWDGMISGDDFAAIDFNIVAQGAPFSTSAGLAGLTAVPEPGGAALGVGAAIGLIKRRRRQA